MRARIEIMAVAVVLACLGTGAPAGAQEMAASLSPPGAFQIDVVPITTSLGTPSLLSADVAKVVTAVGEAYRSLTNGAITVVLRELRQAQAAPREPMRAFHIAGIGTPPADAGFKGVVTVGVVLRNEGSNPAETYGSNILMTAPWDETSQYLLAHEFAHAIGLEHADAAQCSGGSVTTCTIYGYGDRSDTMGLYRPYFFDRPAPLIRFSAVNLRALGILPDDAVLNLTQTREFTLRPVYSGGGIRMALIPAYGSPAYAIEYRPAEGEDEVLGWSRINEAPSRLHGVQVRLLTSNSDPRLNLLPYVVGKTEGAVLTTDGRQGLLAGERMRLPDQSLLEVLAIDTEGARVRVTMLKDTSAPVVRTEAIQWAGNPSSATLMVSGDKYSALRFLVDPRMVKDDRGVASIVLEVDEKTVATKSNPGLFAELEYLPRRTGMFKVRATVRDFAGNQSVVERTLTSLTYRVSSTSVRLVRGAGTLDVIYRPPGPGWTHTLSQLSQGRASAPHPWTDPTWQVIRIINVRPGRDVRFTFTTRDPFGRSDGGRQIRFPNKR